MVLVEYSTTIPFSREVYPHGRDELGELLLSSRLIR
jgi:hypothetical protein